MANRFCANCGANLLNGAKFCVECGEAQPGTTATRPAAGVAWHRYAPVLVVLGILLASGSAVVVGMLSPKERPIVPRRNAPEGSAASSGSLPNGHPPIEIPDEVKQALRELADKAAAAPDDVGMWKHLGEAQYRAAQLDPAYFDMAETAFRHVLDKEPGSLEAIRALGNIAFDRQQAETAITYYRQYLEQKPDDLEVQTDLGTMYLAARKPQAALEQYASVLEANPTFFQAQFNTAIAHRALGDTDKMTAALEKARTLAPDDRTREQIDFLIANAKDLPPPQQGPGAAAAAAPAPPVQAGTEESGAPDAGSFQAAAETLFRQHPIVGPKLVRIEWAGQQTAKVYLRDFPMDQMGDDMKNMFADRMKGRIKEQKTAHQVTASVSFELVDAASGSVMDTITE